MAVMQQALLLVGSAVWLNSYVPPSTGLPPSGASFFSSGGPIVGTYALGPGWPSGVTINGSTGAISGSPANGNYIGLTIVLTLANGQVITTSPFSLNIVPTGVNLVATGLNSPWLLTSTDGTTWSTATFAGNTPIMAVFGSGKWAVVCNAPGNFQRTDIYTSSDGVTWALAYSSPGGTGYFLQYLAGKFVFWINATTSWYVATSTDGISWTLTLTNLPITINAQHLAYDGTRFGAVHLPFNHQVTQTYFSTDLINWTAGGNVGDDWPIYMTYAFGQFLVLNNGYSQFFYTSSNNGANWQQRGIGITKIFSRNCVAAGLIVVLAAGSQTTGALLSSTDAISWTACTLPSTGQWTDITFYSGLWVLVGSDNAGTPYAATSPDLTTWTIRTTPYINSRFVASKTVQNA